MHVGHILHLHTYANPWTWLHPYNTAWPWLHGPDIYDILHYTPTYHRINLHTCIHTKSWYQLGTLQLLVPKLKPHMSQCCGVSRIILTLWASCTHSTPCTSSGMAHEEKRYNWEVHLCTMGKFTQKKLRHLSTQSEFCRIQHGVLVGGNSWPMPKHVSVCICAVLEVWTGHISTSC